MDGRELAGSCSLTVSPRHYLPLWPTVRRDMGSAIGVGVQCGRYRFWLAVSRRLPGEVAPRTASMPLLTLSGEAAAWPSRAVSVTGWAPWNCRSDTSGTSGGCLTVVIEPGCDVCGVEADEASDSDDGDAVFGDEAADVADAGVELFGEAGDIEQVIGRGGSSRVDHGCSPCAVVGRWCAVGTATARNDPSVTCSPTLWTSMSWQESRDISISPSGRHRATQGGISRIRGGLSGFCDLQAEVGSFDVPRSRLLEAVEAATDLVGAEVGEVAFGAGDVGFELVGDGCADGFP